ncbi:hypothetical protein [Acinetobacter soli]|uniref:hypothetical protein n=1 Tax=Acinetobacter soli TaxID=487316 RepID=UPI0032B5FAC6
MKKILLTLLSFIIYFNSFSFAHAASLGGWSIGGSSLQGASVVLNASKEVILNGAKKIANGTAKITPPPSSVAKALAGGAAAVALDLAVKQILGGVDYVLDPANNSITYSNTANSTNSQNRYYYAGTYFYSMSSACDFFLQSLKSSNSISQSATVTYDSNVCTATDGNITKRTGIGISENPDYDSTSPSSQPKTIPLTTVAQKVIDQAASGSPEAQQAIKAAADTIVAEAETDSTKARPIINQFEKTSTIETTEKSTSKSESTTTTNTANPEESTTKTDTATEFPVFCGWAPTICEAANVVIQKPGEWAENIKAAYDDAVDFFKSEPEDTQETQVQFPQEEPPLLDTRIFKASGECPPDFTYSFPLPFGGSHTISYSYATVCYWFSKLYYIVVTVASIISIRIASGTEGKSNG